MINDILEDLSKKFELIIFTASQKYYADVVINYIDPEKKFFQHRFYRDSCIATKEGFYIKDLRIFTNRSLKNMVIVDNSPISFALQIENGIPIIPFYDNKDDFTLKELKNFLNELYFQENAQKFLNNKLKICKFSEFIEPIALFRNIFNIDLLI